MPIHTPDRSYVQRCSVSLEPDLLDAFDGYIAEHGYATRSEAIRDLIRDRLVQRSWEQPDSEVVGTLTLVYDHHATDLAHALSDLQHHHHDAVVCTTHIHLNAHDCLEVTVLRGKSRDVQALANNLLAHKGVKHGKLVTATASDRPC